MWRWIAALWVVGASWAVGPAAGAEAAALGERYFNLAEGYSLCPPAEATRVEERSPSRTVTWNVTDPATGAVAWGLAARRVSSELTAKKLQAYADGKVHEAASGDKIKLESCQVTRVAGRPAVDMRAVVEEQGQRWTRTTVILVKDKDVLMLMVAGPLADREALLATHEAVLNSLELVDPKVQAMRRETNLAAGRELLRELTPEKVRAAVETEDFWGLILRDGAAVGFVASRDRWTTVDGRAGVEGRAWTRVTEADGTVQRLEVVAFAAADRSVEDWTATVRTTLSEEDGGGEQTLIVRLAKRGRSITLSQTLDGNDGPPIRSTLSEKMGRSYLPGVMESLVPRVANLGKSRSYAFAAYAPGSKIGELDVCTFEVIGPDEIEWNGQKIQAVHTTLQAAEDEEALDAWYARSGRLLRQRLKAGAVLERTTREEVLRRYPAAGEMVEAIDSAPGGRAAVEETR